MLSTLLVVGVISHLWCAARLVGIAHHSFYSVYIYGRCPTVCTFLIRMYVSNTHAHVRSVSVPIIATFCPFALQVGRTSPWSNDTTDLGKGSIKLQASIVWKGWLKSFSSYRRFYRTKSIGDNKNGQPDYRHHSKRSILR